MSVNRKLQAEIDRLLKKVTEGCTEFDSILEKVRAAANTNQKEKYEADLKKEIKKLQRCRDQIKSWISSNDVKMKEILVDARKKIEERMEEFKACEKDSKTKAFSKEGLSLASQDDGKSEARNWIRKSLAELNAQIDQFEVEIEATPKDPKKKGENPQIKKLQELIKRHGHHTNMLERILRHLENDSVSNEQVLDIKPTIDYYIEENQNEDFMEDETVYDTLGLPEEDAFDLDEESSANEDEEDGSSEERREEKAAAREERKAERAEKERLREAAKIAANPPKPQEPPQQPPQQQPPQQPQQAPTPVTAPAPQPVAPVVTPPAPVVATPAPQPVAPVVTPVAPVVATPTPQPPTPKKQATPPQPAPTPTKATAWSKNPEIPTPAQPATPAQPETRPPAQGKTTTPQPADKKAASPSPTPPQQQPVAQPTPITPTPSTPNTPVSKLIVPPQPTSQPTPTTPAQPATPAQPTQPTNKANDPRITKTQSQAALSQNRFKDDVPPGQYLRNTASAEDISQNPPSNASRPSAFPPISSPLPAPVVPQADPKMRLPSPGITQPTAQPINPQSSMRDRFLEREDAKNGETFDSYSGYEPTMEQLSWSTQEKMIPPIHSMSSFEGSIQEPQSVAFTMMELSSKNLPEPLDIDRPKQYTPRYPSTTPPYYPQAPPTLFDNPSTFEKFDPDTLFFIFYFQQGTYQQYLAAKELKKHSWRFHKKYCTWFQRHEEPKEITPLYEKGTYVYFDFESGWVQRKKTEFMFEYQYLEDE